MRATQKHGCDVSEAEPFWTSSQGRRTGTVVPSWLLWQLCLVPPPCLLLPLWAEREVAAASRWPGGASWGRFTCCRPQLPLHQAWGRAWEPGLGGTSYLLAAVTLESHLSASLSRSSASLSGPRFLPSFLPLDLAAPEQRGASLGAVLWLALGSRCNAPASCTVPVPGASPVARGGQKAATCRGNGHGPELGCGPELCPAVLGDR